MARNRSRFKACVSSGSVQSMPRSEIQAETGSNGSIHGAESDGNWMKGVQVDGR